MMFRRKKNQAATSALFFTLGAVAGAAIALLYAPTTGKKLQKQLRAVVDDQVENIEKVVRKVANA
jgi:gas vesicle protein